MDITSCDACGVLYDLDVIEFKFRDIDDYDPDDDEQQEVFHDHFECVNDKFISIIKCTVCKEGSIRKT